MIAYLGVDIGGTKTLMAVFNGSGELTEQLKFPTPSDYKEFLTEFQRKLLDLKETEFQAAGIAVPGLIDRKHGRIIAMGNLDWKDKYIQEDIEQLVQCPVVIENDSKLAALSEATLIKNDYKKVLYITISTGIGAGLIIDGVIDPTFADSEGGHMLLENKGKLQTWESFASGKAIVEKYGKLAQDITDAAAWKDIAHNIAVGVINLIAVVQPEIVLLGGGVGTHFNKYKEYLLKDLKGYEMPLVPIPPVKMAQRPEEAAIYGTYEFAKKTYGKTS